MRGTSCSFCCAAVNVCCYNATATRCCSCCSVQCEYRRGRKHRHECERERKWCCGHARIATLAAVTRSLWRCWRPAIVGAGIRPSPRFSYVTTDNDGVDVAGLVHVSPSGDAWHGVANAGVANARLPASGFNASTKYKWARGRRWSVAFHRVSGDGCAAHASAAHAVADSNADAAFADADADAYADDRSRADGSAAANTSATSGGTGGCDTN